MSWVWSSDSWIYQKWGVCWSGCTALLTSVRSMQVTPPRTPSASLRAYCHPERWKMEMQALCTASHWDKAGSLLTCPRPSPPIFPPASIDYAVGGRTLSSVFSCPPFSALPQATPADMLPSYQMTYLPLAADFMDVLSAGPDMINGDCHTEWDIFLKNIGFYRKQPDHLQIGFADLVRHYSIWPCKEMREASGPRTR